MNKSQWQISNRFIVMLVIPFALAFLGIVFLQSLVPSGKLRDNQFALSHCRWELKIWKNVNTNSPSFTFDNLASDDRRRAVVLLGYVLDAWGRTNFVWENDKSKREIVIVCGKEFDNVPKPSLWNFYHRNPAHAVGYSDGTADLISPSAYTNLDLSQFIRLSDLQTTNLSASPSK